MTRVEALEEEIKKLSSEEMAELREWIASQERAEVPKKGKYTSLDIHRMLFPDGPPPYATVATGSKYRLRRGSATKPRTNIETRKMATVRPICADVLLIQLLHVNRCS